MRKLIAVAAMVLSTTAVAQSDKDWWACQHVHSAGMNWENNRWMTTTFKEGSPFVLMSDGNGSLTKESVAKTLVGDSKFAHHFTCDVHNRLSVTLTCYSRTGESLFFDAKAGKGGISKLYGSTTTATDYRDTVTVSAFECTKG